MNDKNTGIGTRLSHGGISPQDHYGFVNPPVYRGSTVLFENTAALQERSARYLYGRRGTPTTDALINLITDLEGGENTILTSCGLSAITTAILALVKSGDHILMTDSVYRPSRHFCETVLSRLGVDTQYYDPLIGAGIADLIKDNTRIVFLETPGSQTFEMQDIPAMISAIKAHANSDRIFTMADNTWATGLFFRPLDFGVDISVQACTKYVVGHSDAMLGAATANARTWTQLHASFDAFGVCPGTEETFLGTRGMRTLEVRLRRHMASALEVATWLENCPEIAQVLCPALENAPGHDIWKRDFTGASGLFSVLLNPVSEKAVAAMLDGLEYFGLGYSWGGFESLVIPFDPSGYRTATHWDPAGPGLRFHIGLEDPSDLIQDLAKGFTRLNAV